jgi:hypothetical protein
LYGTCSSPYSDCYYIVGGYIGYPVSGVDNWYGVASKLHSNKYLNFDLSDHYTFDTNSLVSSTSTPRVVRKIHYDSTNKIINTCVD